MEAGGDALFPRRGRQQITRELLHCELIEGQVAVHRVDDPVAVEVRIWAQGVIEVARAVRVPRLIQPVSAPALTEMPRRQQAVDQPRLGVGRPVVDEGLHVRWRGRQADQIETQATDEGAAVGGRGWRHSFAGEPCADKTVDRMRGPRDFRRLWVPGRLE